MKQNERLVKEMPSLMQIQYGLNTLRIFPHQKRYHFIGKYLPAEGVIGKDRCSILFSKPGMRPTELYQLVFLALEKTSVQKKVNYPWLMQSNLVDQSQQI